MMEDCMIVDDRPVGRRSLWQSSLSRHRYFPTARRGREGTARKGNWVEWGEAEWTKRRTEKGRVPILLFSSYFSLALLQIYNDY